MATPSAPVISNAPLASPNTLEYWWYPPTSDGGAAIEDYQLVLNPGGLTCNVGGPGTYYKVTGLTNAQTYFTTIAASNANGLGATASFREFQPGSPPPVGVSTLSATAVFLSTGAALVSWTPPITLPNATIFWYAINGYTTADSLTPVLKYTAGGQTQSNYFIPGLNSSINYYFTVRAVNCPGWSVPLSTNTITFVTSVAFAPTMLSGLQLWFDAADSSSLITSGTNITQWNDKSGNVYNGTGVNSPQYTTGQYVTFNGTNQYFTLPNNALPSGNSAYSYFGIVNFTTGARYSGIIGGGSYGTNNNTLGFRLDPSNKIVTYWWNNDILTTNTINTNVITYVNTMYDGSANRQTMLTFSNITTGTVVTPRSQTTGNNTIGVTNTTEYMSGRIYEIITYSNQVTPFNRQKIEGYLAWKWGLQTQLPTTHPFSSAAPQSNSVFSPPQFSTLRFWYDAQDSDTIIRTGNSVTQWNDKSSNALHMRRVGLSTITYISSAVNNYPAIYCSSAGLSTSATVLSPTSQLTYFMVLNQTQPSPAVNSGLFESAANYRHLILFTRGGGCNNVTLVLNNSAENNTGSNIAGLNTLLGFTTNGVSASASIFVNGNTTNTFTTGSSFPLSVSQPYRLAASAWAGNICEVMAYSNALSTQDRQTVEGYLAWKWGLQGNLPTTHPYRYNNPGIVNFTQISPTSFSNLGMWLDASQITGVSNTSSITTWVDRSSNAYVGGASNGPTFITNSVNGLPVVRFNGSSQYINFGSTIMNISTNTGVAVFSVVKFNNTSSGGIIGKTIYGPGDGRWALTRDTVTGLGMNAQFFIQSGGTVTESIYADTTTTTQLIEGTWDRQNQYIYQNGLQRDSDARATMSSFNTTYPLYVGAYPNGAGSAPQYYMNGDIAEILVYMTNVTPFIRQQIEGYLTWKWGLQASLPTTHPYFTAPPQQAYTVFNPLLYSGLQLWLDAQDSATVIRTGASISQWNDKSGKGYNATPYQGTNPTYSTTGLNSQACVQFNSNDAMRSPIPAGTFPSGLTSYVVFQKTGARFSYDTVITRTTGNNGAPFDMYNTTRIIGAGGGGNTGNSTYDLGLLTTPTIYGFNVNSSGWNENINGSNQVNPVTTGTNYGDVAPFVYIASRSDNFINFRGNMGEVLIYSGILSTGQRQTVEGYLAWKWGLQGQLPVTHPYALINPANPTARPTVTETGLLIRFDATTYSGSGAWTNTGSLGTGYNATITVGQTPTKNAAGNGIVLNGSSGWTFANIGQQTSFTISGWFKLGATMATDFMAFITDGTTGSSVINMSLLGRNSSAAVGNQQFAGGFYDGSQWRITGITTLNLNTWYMLTASFDNSTKILTTYLNGLSVNTATFASSTPNTSAQVYRIGQQITGTASYITGEVGQVLIYSRALTATEVLQNFTATQNTFSV
jgi:hypothetical protein